MFRRRWLYRRSKEWFVKLYWTTITLMCWWNWGRKDNTWYYNYSWVITYNKLIVCCICSVPRRNGDVYLEWYDDTSTLQSKKLREMDEDGPQIKYFSAQLELFAKMCYYRQYLGSNKIKEQLPINVVLQLAWIWYCLMLSCSCSAHLKPLINYSAYHPAFFFLLVISSPFSSAHLRSTIYVMFSPGVWRTQFYHSDWGPVFVR